MEREIFYTSQYKVSCSGSGEFGHPLVYLDVSAKGEINCPYCGKVFIYRDKKDG